MSITDKNIIYITGHINPDTDSIASALVLADFFYQRDDVDTQAIALGEINNETSYVLQQLGIDAPRICETLPAGSALWLVDHNEAVQSIANLADVQLCGIIDHHKLGGLKTDAPIYIRNEPIASTCSILAKMYDEEGIEITPPIATLMLAGMISDTLYLRSPTTTGLERELIPKLAQTAGIVDVASYAAAMFDAKSDISSLQTGELVLSDYKEFAMGDVMVGIGVHETTSPENVLERQDAITDYMRTYTASHNLHAMLFVVVDILNECATVLVGDETVADIVQRAFGVEVVDSRAMIGNRISRKKTIVPPISELF